MAGNLRAGSIRWQVTAKMFKFYKDFLHNLKNLFLFSSQKPNRFMKIVRKTKQVKFKKNQAKGKKVIWDF